MMIWQAYLVMLQNQTIGYNFFGDLAGLRLGLAICKKKSDEFGNIFNAPSCPLTLLHFSRYVRLDDLNFPGFHVTTTMWQNCENSQANRR